MADSKEKLAFATGMAANGNGHANGHGVKNGGSLGRKIMMESGGFVLAEGASILTGLGVVAVADMIIPKSIMDGASAAVGKVIEPFLDHIEWARAKVCKLEECQTDLDVPREERARNLGKTLIVFSAAYAASMAVKLKVRRKINEVAGIIEHAPAKLAAGASLWDRVKYYGTFQHVTPQEKLIFAADESVHYGSMWMLNSPLAPFTDDMIKHTTNIIQKVTGFDKKKAGELSDMFWIWDAPNILGGLAGVGIIAANHSMGLATKGTLGKILSNKTAPGPTSHVEKLAQRSASLHPSVGA